MGEWYWRWGTGVCAGLGRRLWRAGCGSGGSGTSPPRSSSSSPPSSPPPPPAMMIGARYPPSPPHLHT